MNLYKREASIVSFMDFLIEKYKFLTCENVVYLMSDIRNNKISKLYTV